MEDHPGGTPDPGQEAKPTSPWLESVPLLGPPLTRDAETEVVIVGAGATGLAAALALAEAGRQVTVLEQRSVASGLSGRGAGALLASSGRWLARDERELGAGKARARRALARRGLERVRLLGGGAAGANLLDCGLAAAGSTLLALSPREWADAVRTHELLAAEGEAGELLDRAAVRHRAASSLFAGGLVDAGDLALDPVLLLRGLARRAMALGVRLHEGTAVTGFEEPPQGGVLVRTARGGVRAAMMVLAVNAWTPRLLPAMADRVMPHRAQALLTVPMSAPVPAGVWIANHGHEHWRRLASGAVLFGGCRETTSRTEEGLAEDATGKVQGMMERFLSRAFPAIAESQITHRWAGAAASTCDGMPILGPPPGHSAIVLACGFGEHELALSIGAGMTAADLVQVGRVESAEPFSARRFL